MSDRILRDWFVPGEGIDRHVISAGIQKYLGNDATVRPGRVPDESGNGNMVEGFWIKAYRTLTEPMKDDLKRDTTKWRNERERTGRREFLGSQTFQNANDGRVPARTDNDSPMRDAPFAGPPPPVRDGRIPGPDSRMQDARIPSDRFAESRMPVDNMMQGRPDPRFAGPRPFGQDGRPYPLSADGRNYIVDGHQYPLDQPMHDTGYNRPSGPPFAQDPGYGYAGYAPHNGNGNNFPRQDYYPSVSSPFDQNMTIPTTRGEPMQFQGQGQQQPYGGMPNQMGQGRDGRDTRDFPRDMARDQQRYPQNEYVEPRFYPSPTPTTTSVSMPHEPITHPASYAAPPPPHYPEQFNGRRSPNYGAGPEVPYQSRDAQYGRDRPTASDDTRDARRRKIQ